MKTDKDKQLLLEQLKKIPIVLHACEKTGISPATYYRWKSDDKEFQQAADDAIHDGEQFVNDLSEGQVIALIKERNFAAISFWLRAHHHKYMNKLEVTTQLRSASEELTPEQQSLVHRALRLASLVGDEVNNITNVNQKQNNAKQ